MCVFSVEIQTIAMKFGTEVVNGLGRFGGGVFNPVASAMHFGENFIKQKLQGTPYLVGTGHLFGPQMQIWKDLGPVCF